MRRSSLDDWFFNAKKGDAKKLVELIGNKTAWNIDVRDEKARTALFLAVESGNLTCVENLLQNGADPNRRSQFGAPAHMAIETRNVEMLRLLLGYGAHTYTENDKHLTVLECANQVFGEQNVQYILETIDAKKDELESKRRASSLKGQGGRVLITTPLPEVQPKDITHCFDDVYAEGPYSLYTKGIVDKDCVIIKKYKNTGNKELVKKLFSNEVMILSDLRHPNILLLMSACYGPSTSDLCMVLEPVEQQVFLHKMIHVDHEQIADDFSLRIARDVVCGLLFLHNRGFIHCYLGSHSVVINKQTKQAKICNFEYARAVHIGTSSDEPISHLEPLYEWMAPEQLEGMAADQHGDVYSFGILVWEMLTGKRPFHGIYNFKSLTGGKEDPRVRTIPAKWIGFMKELVRDCLLPPAVRPTSEQVFEWLDGVVNNRLVHYRPAHLTLEELPPLFPLIKPKPDKRKSK
ncbi:serine/threonine-protein kinase STY13-like [Actinia tenebrosa]|uniref:Serine/threonine-protein kinase STY13-like n=1 Tax=Actinia tenebrosa TaxID=6105 RepID=A0A6P8HSF0_ACTTE|nr:serine/threonine-protein kinase STY13-like [Actinia tenebrosa]